MKVLEESKGYKKLLAAVEKDEREHHDQRYGVKLQWVVDRVKHYAERTGLDAADILDKWEEGRTYWYMNYYQDCNQPELDGKVRVFDTVDELRLSIGDKGFRCPCCHGVTTNPYVCNSGVIVKAIKDGKDGPCNWKVGGLFRDLGKGVHVFVKSELVGETIFMPIAWEKDAANADAAQEAGG